MIFHSDRGNEYTAASFAALCRALGVTQSMGRVGSALDNSPAEAFNSTLKVEFVYRHRFRTRAEARLKIVTWITDFYNPTRRPACAVDCPRSTTKPTWLRSARPGRPRHETRPHKGPSTLRGD
ncbi:integrase core domain-containing protein [Nocardia farcinica]|uniref:Putative transposase n=1 Tax=Nocardia farcinica (strain IFM 10152) TaxID=247156 RepID=Q5YR99_NOCFA|nr:integrase core domain-containing protein [Nocardia farcinica]BAD59292.1 putative transposase [Nocardia farcinica IFM 10152]